MVTGGGTEPAKKMTEKEQICRDHLIALRWPKGVRCIYCAADVYRSGRERNGAPRWQCKTCLRRFGIATGTALQDARLSYEMWARAIELLLTDGSTTLLAFERFIGLSHRAACAMWLTIRGAIAAAPQRKIALESVLKILLAHPRAALSGNTEKL